MVTHPGEPRLQRTFRVHTAPISLKRQKGFRVRRFDSPTIHRSIAKLPPIDGKDRAPHSSEILRWTGVGRLTKFSLPDFQSRAGISIVRRTNAHSNEAAVLFSLGQNTFGHDGLDQEMGRN